MAITMYPRVAPVVLFCGHSSYSKYVANIRVGQYSPRACDTQPKAVIIDDLFFKNEMAQTPDVPVTSLQ